MGQPAAPPPRPRPAAGARAQQQQKSGLLRRALARVEPNAPVTVLLCAAALAARVAEDRRPGTTVAWLSAWPLSAWRHDEPRSWVRLVSHAVGHFSWEHLLGNVSTLLLVCPLLEDEYGSAALLATHVSAAASAAVAHMYLGPERTALAGASSLVFASTLLASFGGRRRLANGKGEGRVPLTTLLTVLLVCFREVALANKPIAGASQPGEDNKDAVYRSALAHAVGGVVGCAAGLALRPRAARRAKWEASFDTVASGKKWK